MTSAPNGSPSIRGSAVHSSDACLSRAHSTPGTVLSPGLQLLTKHAGSPEGGNKPANKHRMRSTEADMNVTKKMTRRAVLFYAAFYVFMPAFLMVTWMKL